MTRRRKIAIAWFVVAVLVFWLIERPGFRCMGHTNGVWGKHFAVYASDNDRTLFAMLLLPGGNQLPPDHVPIAVAIQQDWSFVVQSSNCSQMRWGWGEWPEYCQWRSDK